MTGIAGAISAGFLTYQCIIWYRLATHDGGDLGYYLIFIPAGLLSGLLIGAVMARNVSGFWRAQGCSLGVVIGVCALIGVVARMYGEAAPELNGDQLILQVELKYPHGWEPDQEVRKPETRYCQLQPVLPGRRIGSGVQGNIDWSEAGQVDGQWVVPCSLRLFSSREDRFVSVNLGKTFVEFYLKLPPDPKPENRQWSPWITDGFSHEVGKPPVTDFAYRCRVRGINEIRDEADAARNAFWQARDDAAKAIGADAPMASWLALFEDPDGSPAEYRWGGAERIERKAVAARVLDLAPLLASPDRTTMRRAIFTLGSLQETPEPLVEPLITAGRLVIDLIREARTQTADERNLGAESRARQLFQMWDVAMRNAGSGPAPRFGAILEEIEREADAKTVADFYGITSEVRIDLAKLGPRPAAQ